MTGDVYEWRRKYRRVLHSDTELDRTDGTQVYGWLLQESSGGPKWFWYNVRQSYFPIEWSKRTISQVFDVPQRNLP